ncbi:MAG: lysine--tRNA ligase [Alphaproteobacteria bacterium]|nr:lysine--tRNA ligase [Alphaproteobacteria bacterium]
MPDIRELATHAKAWPFQEARRVLKRVGGKTPDKGYVLFETGYGPSGLPHIGTFGEVLRTTMVRHAFQRLSDIPTRLFAFSDDMDGLRKVPDNMPNKEMLAQHLHKPLTAVPDPFGTHDSFGAHNNARLRAFLDDFGFEYEFVSSTECYTSGRFDTALRRMLECYDQVMEIMLPTLGEERRRTYSPFLPVCPETGHVLQVPVLETNPAAGTIVYQRADGRKVETPVTGGRCKLQWKPDWAMRWYALNVDYEMSGKDLIDSVQQSSRICRVLGGRTPETFTYELFLDENGEKISKSRGNGLTIEEWLAYAPKDSLALFMFGKPTAAKRLYFDVIPKNVDEYLTFLAKYPGEEPARQIENPVWHIHDGRPPAEDVPLTFGVLLNLASVCNTEDKSVLWGFVSRYVSGATPESHPILDQLVGHAIRYYADFVKPAKRYRAPTGTERQAIEALAGALAKMPAGASAEELQNEVYEVGKRFGFEQLRDWFRALYEVLLGQEQGPRMGSFIALYGVPETVALIRQALSAEGLSAA